MKKLKVLQIIFDRIFNKLFKVTSVEKLLKQREDMKNTLHNVEETRNGLHGSIQTKKIELTKTKSQLKEVELKIAEYIKKDNDKKAEEGYTYKIQLEKEIKRLQISIDANEKILKQTEKQIAIYEKKITQISNNIDELKAKEEFTRNANEFKNNMRALDCEDIKDITDEINKDYYAQSFALDKIADDEKTIDEYIDQDKEGFKKYVDKIRKKK